jgi:4-hydroxythreonine-4-phosphate dehydrogenase
MTAIPKIGISLGDPAGVGPEIVVKTFSQPGLVPEAAYVIFGSGRVLNRDEKALGLKLALAPYAPGQGSLRAGLYLNEDNLPLKLPAKGVPSAAGGRASFAYFEKAVAAAQGRELEAVVTAPISKQAWGLAGIEWRGHTDYLTRAYPKAIMAFWSDRLKVALLSHHISLRDAAARVKADVLEDFFKTLAGSLDYLALRPFRFLVAGLNPHAGEDGLMGDEEREVAAAVGRARRSGLDIEGPCPPDTVFRRALGQPDTVVVALYHDQGLIPFKLEAFETGVNLTLGLPFIRTSPDHGTAYDIAARRTADPGSFINAVRLAAQLVTRYSSRISRH